MRKYKAGPSSFPHFSGFRNHKRILATRNRFGSAVGYSFCCILMELISKKHSKTWKTNHLIDMSTILGISERDVSEMIDYVVNLGMFISNDLGIFYSDQTLNSESKVTLLCRSGYEHKRMADLYPAEWSDLKQTAFKRDEYTCQYCGEKGGKLEGDHIIPFSKGGIDSIENIATSCQKCNRQKRDKTVLEFLEWRKSKIETDSYEVLPA